MDYGLSSHLMSQNLAKKCKSIHLQPFFNVENKWDTSQSVTHETVSTSEIPKGHCRGTGMPGN